MVPELAANDNYGQIGVKLLANAELRHRWPLLPCHLRSGERCVRGVLHVLMRTLYYLQGLL